MVVQESERDKMKRTKNILWGLLLIAIGTIWGLNACGITSINIFFDGWWTLFIIVPCIMGLFTEHDKTGNVIGIIIGLVLLLACQNIIRFDILWKLLVPAILVIIGLKMIFRDSFDRKVKEVIAKMKENGTPLKEYCATFSGIKVNPAGERFERANVTAVFGGVDLDLRNAIIEADVVVNITSVFGGVDLYVPDNVNVKIASTCIFGGISDKRAVKAANYPMTIYINATCMFGGVDLK